MLRGVFACQFPEEVLRLPCKLRELRNGWRKASQYALCFVPTDASVSAPESSGQAAFPVGHTNKWFFGATTWLQAMRVPETQASFGYKKRGYNCMCVYKYK